MVLTREDIDEIQHISDDEWTVDIVKPFIEYLEIYGNIDNIDKKDINGSTMLSTLVNESTQNMVNVNSSNPKLRSNNNKYLDNIKKLIDLGANPFIKDSDGNNVYRILEINKDKSIYEHINPEIKNYVYTSIKKILDEYNAPTAAAAAGGGYKTNKKRNKTRSKKTIKKRSMKKRNKTLNKNLNKKTNKKRYFKKRNKKITKKK